MYISLVAITSLACTYLIELTTDQCLCDCVYECDVINENCLTYTVDRVLATVTTYDLSLYSKQLYVL